jgi:hypothetical protein
MVPASVSEPRIQLESEIGFQTIIDHRSPT